MGIGIARDVSRGELGERVFVEAPGAGEDEKRCGDDARERGYFTADVRVACAGGVMIAVA